MSEGDPAQRRPPPTAGRIIDVTVGIGEGSLVWPGDPRVAVEPWTLTSRGEPANVSELRLGSHTGTHVDPPAHFLDGGLTVDRLPLDVLVGPAAVVDLRGVAGPVGVSDLEALSLAAGVERLLVRTDNSSLWSEVPARFPDDYVSVSPAAARWLVDWGVRLVGVDFLSIEPLGESGFPVHRTLLEAGVVLVEGLDLSGAPAGEYGLVCLPLKVVDGDGAPARCVLVEPERRAGA